jgi:hypothetical protein
MHLFFTSRTPRIVIFVFFMVLIVIGDLSALCKTSMKA